MRFAAGLLCCLGVLLALPGCDRRKNDSFLLHNVVTDYMVTPTFAVAYRAQHGGYLELEPTAGGYERVRITYGAPNARHTALAAMNGDTGWAYYHWMPANFPALAYPLTLQCYAPGPKVGSDTTWESVADSLLVRYKTYLPAVQWLRAGHDWYSLQNHDGEAPIWGEPRGFSPCNRWACNATPCAPLQASGALSPGCRPGRWA